MTNLPIQTRAAVPIGLRSILDGPVRTGTVLSAHPSAIYLDFDGDVVALVDHTAVAVPCALVLVTPLPPGLASSPIWVGAGTLTVGALRVEAGRFVDRQVPRLPSPDRSSIAHARALLATVDFTEHPETIGLDELTAARLIGRGTGLTPSGDDIVAGYLVAAHAWGQSCEPVRSFVDRYARERTTSLSAALLRHAAAGEAIPELAAFLAAVSEVDDDRRVESTLAALLAIGHTSGVALAIGVVAAAGQLVTT